MFFLAPRRGGAGEGHEAPTLQPLAGILKILPQHLLNQVHHITAGTAAIAIKMVSVQVAGGCPLTVERAAHFMLNYMKSKAFCGVAQVVGFLDFVNVYVVHDYEIFL